MEWEVSSDDYDYHQEIARSGFADMLHDTERNKKFDWGIKKAIATVHARGESSRVLDVGTGTGLLSMMAIRAGAHNVTACEAFQPMSECAVRVIADNGLSERITVIHKRSTDMTVGPDGDMSERANILVAELLDTELIGEGALHTYRHAHTHLLTSDCLMVPHAANVYAQIVDSPYLRRHTDVLMHHLPRELQLNVPSEIESCAGTPSVHDIQLNQLDSDLFTILSNPKQILRFDFTHKALPLKETKTDCVPIIYSGTAHAVFMWWSIELDSSSEVVLSCAPHWAHPNQSEMQWRDHWLQGVYYPSRPITVVEGESVNLTSCHDDYNFWFHVSSLTNSMTAMTVNHQEQIERPLCNCSLHLASSRQRIAMLTDPRRLDVYIESLRNVLTKDSVCLIVSDGSLLGFIAAKLGAKKVYILERDVLLNRLAKRYIECNDLLDRVHVISDDIEQLSKENFHKNEIDVVMAEPFVSGSSFPLDNFYCWCAFSHIANHLAHNVTILPRNVTVKAIGVQFDDLWKIKASVRTCEQFNLNAFDELIEDSVSKSDAYLDQQPLWEYPCVALTKTIDLLTFDWTKSLQELGGNVSTEGTVPFSVAGMCNGFVVWTESVFTRTITDGPLQETIPGQKILWDPYTKQSIHLIKDPEWVSPRKSAMKYTVEFSPSNLDFDVFFEVIKT